MKPTLLALLTAMTLAAGPGPAHATDATGHWKGRIANALDVHLQFEKAQDGKWEGTMTVPQQGMKTKVDQLAVSEERIGFKLLSLNGTYSARWSEADKAWLGSWSQNGQTVPLRLERSEAAVDKPKRPQLEAIAARPASYISSEVGFTNPAGGHSLAGTFTVPKGKGPFPAVVLVHGSGPADRDETLFGHKPFLVLADHLSSQGIAVLRYDKRGIGKSGGSYKGSTTNDFAGDAEAAIRFLRGRPEVDAGRIGIVGHSEGGLIAPMVAARDPKLAFAVMLAGPGVRADVLMVEQLARIAKFNGVSEELIDKERELNRALFAALAAEPDLELAGKQARQILDEAERKGILPAGGAEQRARGFTSAWFHAFLRHDPAPVLQSVRQPILVLNGELDQQVPAELDLTAIRAALKDNPHATIKELPALNHLFQTARTGAGAEYAVIEETMAPLALDTVSAWILATVKPQRLSVK
jgi:hypothetical protein